MKFFAQMSFVVLLVFAAATTAAMADPVTITFEQPPCTALSPGIFPGNCYEAVGLFLSSGPNFTQAFAIGADPRGVSQPNVARALPGFTRLGGSFIVPPVGHGFGTSAVSFNVIGSVTGHPWEVVFMGMDSDLLRIRGDSDQIVSFARGVPREFMGGEIFRFDFFSGSALQGIDNLTFGAPQLSATPEPSTLLLFGTTAAALLRRRAKRSSAW
jgi:hypothetical protein